MAADSGFDDDDVVVAIEDRGFFQELGCMRGLVFGGKIRWKCLRV